MNQQWTDWRWLVSVDSVALRLLFVDSCIARSWTWSSAGKLWCDLGSERGHAAQLDETRHKLAEKNQVTVKSSNHAGYKSNSDVLTLVLS